jgi:hypothetical protein
VPQPGEIVPQRNNVIRMQWLGANPTPSVSGTGVQAAKVNYFLGNDPAKWRSNVPTYGRVHYNDVYPGIDLVYYGNQNDIEYDFVVAPGADPNAIALSFKGADGIEINPQGDLILHTAAGELIQQRPYIYQELNGTRQPVDGEFRIQNSEFNTRNSELKTFASDSSFILHPSSFHSPYVTFSVGEYDATRPLVIDPIMTYSTYLGSSGADFGYGVASDVVGNVYMTGYTASINFPLVDPVMPYSGDGDAFVSKFSRDGSALLFSTYIGGSKAEAGRTIALDATGNIYIAGATFSPDFPTVNAFQPVFGAGWDDAIVAKIDATGSSLIYSSYLGGSGADRCLRGLAVNAAGEAIVTGLTLSTDFPTANAYQPAPAGDSEVFITKVAAAGGSLVFSTYLGGPESDYSWGVALDPEGNPVLIATAGAGFPLVNPFQPTYAGGGDLTVTKLSADGTSIIFSSYLGGTGPDEGYGVAVAPNGTAFVTGMTWSNNFPTVDPVQTNQNERDAFLTMINSAGTAILFSTFLGGNNIDQALDVAVGPDGNPIIVGQSWSHDFLLFNPVQPNYGGGTSDAIVAKFSAERKSLIYSTYIGGNDDDDGNAIAIDPAGAAIITGYTASPNFPRVNAWQSTYGGSGDTFLTRIASRR